MSPNFSQNEQTGAVSEDEVGVLFKKWGWGVGRDRIDVGYDLFVQPDKVRYRGSRFLVQVKGTAQKGRRAGLVAPVKKSRLIEYVRNPIPVFLIRASADGRFYWLHVQEWSKTNRSRLSGSGIAGVKMDSSCELANREQFEAYLDKVLAPPGQRAGSIAAMAEERSIELSEIDPNFIVRVGVNSGQETHELFARTEDAKANFNFKPDQKHHNIINLKEAIEFGLPRSIDVSEFKMSGSPLFDALNISQPRAGTMTLQGKGRNGVVRLYPGREFSLMVQCLEIQAELFSGQKGLAISSDSLDGLFMVEARIPLPGSGKTTFSLRHGKLTSVPIQHLTELANAGVWAEQVVDEQAVFPELVFGGKRGRLGATPLNKSINPWLHQLRLLSQMHLIAKFFDLDFIVPVDCTLTTREAEDISLAYQLLRGARLDIDNVSFEFESTVEVPVAGGKFGIWATTNIVLTAGGSDFAAIPVLIDMPGYVVDPVPGTSKLRCHHPEGQKAAISYYSEGESDIAIRRTQAPNSSA